MKYLCEEKKIYQDGRESQNFIFRNSSLIKIIVRGGSLECLDYIINHRNHTNILKRYPDEIFSLKNDLLNEALEHPDILTFLDSRVHSGTHDCYLSISRIVKTGSIDVIKRVLLLRHCPYKFLERVLDISSHDGNYKFIKFALVAIKSPPELSVVEKCIQHNFTDCVKYIFRRFPNILKSYGDIPKVNNYLIGKILPLAVRKKNIEIIKILVGAGVGTSNLEYFIELDPDFIKSLSEIIPSISNDKLCLKAVYTGCIDYLSKITIKDDLKNLSLMLAVKSGNINTMKYLIDNVGIQPLPDLYIIASEKKCNIDIMRYLHSIGIKPIHAALRLSIENGDFEKTKFLNSISCEWQGTYNETQVKNWLSAINQYIFKDLPSPEYNIWSNLNPYNFELIDKENKEYVEYNLNVLYKPY